LAIIVIIIIIITNQTRTRSIQCKNIYKNIKGRQCYSLLLQKAFSDTTDLEFAETSRS